LEDVLDCIRPYVGNGKTDEDVRIDLQYLGVESRSDLLKLNESDVSDIMAPLKFRACIEALTAKGLFCVQGLAIHVVIIYFANQN
jgi:hypothetical protein